MADSIVNKIVSELGFDPESAKQLVEYAISLPDRYQITRFLEDILGSTENKIINDCVALSNKTRREEEAKQRSIKQEGLPAKNEPQFKYSKGVWGSGGSSSANPKPKRPPKPQQQQTQSTTKVKVDSLADIEAALRQLDSSSKERQTCDCMATRHPLLEIAPNCLNCGKIICTKEGLGPCSSCGNPLLSNDDLEQINEVLRLEREQITAGMSKKALKQAGIDTGKTLSSVGTTTNSGSSDALEKAHARLNTLLDFQESSAQRTKIIDQVSDFETPFQGVNRWASPIEQAQQLKKQQRQLRKMHEQQLQRSGRGKKVISIDLKGNKVYMNESTESFDSDEEDPIEDSIPEDNSSKLKKKSLTFWNPDTYGKNFIKPIYKPLNSTDKPTTNAIIKKIGIDKATKSDSNLNAVDDETRVLEM